MPKLNQISYPRMRICGERLAACAPRESRRDHAVSHGLAAILTLQASTTCQDGGLYQPGRHHDPASFVASVGGGGIRGVLAAGDTAPRIGASRLLRALVTHRSREKKNGIWPRALSARCLGVACPISRKLLSGALVGAVQRRVSWMDEP